jgi:choice-of-anchor B domain-containing protein
LIQHLPSRSALRLLAGLALALAMPVASSAALVPQRAEPMQDMPGMAELMAALGPNAICPRGACGYGRDGIPEPYAGRGRTNAPGAARTALESLFPAEGARLASWLSSSDMVGTPTNANDIWGYVSPSGREYAIVGLKDGTAFVEVTDPAAPRPIGSVAGPLSDWRDIAVHDEFAYVVNERSGGLQVIDLRRVDRGRVSLLRSVGDLGLRTAHNVYVNSTSGHAYLLGSNLSRGGIVVVDLNDPQRPEVIPTLWDETYVHDIQVVTYTRGRNAGREIAFAFTGPRGLHIIDYTDKSAPVTLSNLEYDNATYGHSGWLDPTGRFLYVNDELDERYGNAASMTTYVVRVGNLRQPRLVRTMDWGLPVIDHNSMVQGDRLYVSAYAGGLRIIDISSPKRPRDAGYVDTYPETDGTRFIGAWGVFAGFPSGTVIVSDITRGLFVVRP